MSQAKKNLWSKNRYVPLATQEIDEGEVGGVWNKLASNRKLLLACGFLFLVILAGTLIRVFQLRNTSPETKGMCKQQLYVFNKAKKIIFILKPSVIRPHPEATLV